MAASDTYQPIYETLLAHTLYASVTKEGQTIWVCRAKGCGCWHDSSFTASEAQAHHQAQVLSVEGIV